jgi:hypothetical protein
LWSGLAWPVAKRQSATEVKLNLIGDLDRLDAARIGDRFDCVHISVSAGPVHQPAELLSFTGISGAENRWRAVAAEYEKIAHFNFLYRLDGLI